MDIKQLDKYWPLAVTERKLLAGSFVWYCTILNMWCVFDFAALQLVVPRVEEKTAELPSGLGCTDEDFLTLLDFASADTVPEWYTPPEYYSVNGVPCTSLVDSMHGAGLSQEAGAGLDNQGTGHCVSNHVWELGSCPWNAQSAACHLGELSSSAEFRPQSSLGEQRLDACRTC